MSLANEMDFSVQLAPPRVMDDAGVPLAAHHLEFVGLDAQAVADWRARRAPMGIKPAGYREFCETFFTAAQADGVIDIDARLKGSAAVMYSGRHKALPASWSEHVAAFTQAHGHPPSPRDEDDLRERYQQFWRQQSVPIRRPFDSMVRLNLDLHPSDYDVQLSSQDIEQRCAASWNAYPQLAPSLFHPTYGFLDSVLVDLAVPTIARWANQWTTRLGRTVAFKAFPATGPGNKTASVGHLSSHFRAEDWMMRVPLAGVD